MECFRRVSLALSLFVFVAAANWATFNRFGSDMPEWDQWDAEGLHLLAPWYERDHFITHLLEPHNEHRLILTKLQNLGVVLANGQWDSRLECVVNALLHAAIAVGLWGLGRRWIARRWLAPFYVAVAALYGLPIAWQNLLGGFHSQQYWLIATSMVAMLLLPFARAWTLSWWAGVGSAMLALGSMGSGFIAAAVVIGILAVRLIARDVRARDVWPTVSAMLVLVIAGLLLRIEVPWHESLKAKTVHDFTLSLLRSLEWPLRDRDWAGALLWAPWVVIAVLCLRATVQRRWHPETAKPQLIVLAFGGWVIVQLLATAYVRGAGGEYPASRYMDTLIFGTAVNALALGWLVSQRQSGKRALVVRGALLLLGISWLTATGIGLYRLVQRNVTDELPSTKTYYIQAEGHLRGYLATNDPAELTDPVPYPSANVLVERLERRVLRDLMPQSVRAPLPIKPGATGGSSFVANHVTQRLLNTAPRAGLSPATPALASRPTWGSYNAAGLSNEGEWRSAPITAAATWLKFETAGHIGEPDSSLELRDAATDTILANVVPTKKPGDSWRSAYVRTPRRPFVIVARDSSPERWLGFSAPVEMEWLSYIAWRLAKHGLLIAEVAAAVALLLGIWEGLARVRGIREERRPLQHPTPRVTA